MADTFLEDVLKYIAEFFLDWETFQIKGVSKWGQRNSCRYTGFLNCDMVIQLDHIRGVISRYCALTDCLFMSFTWHVIRESKTYESYYIIFSERV